MSDWHDDDDREEDEYPPRSGSDTVRIIGDPAGGEGSGERDGSSGTVRRFPLPASEYADEPEWSPTSGEGSGPIELPHWTEPPTGEIPRILPEDPNAASSDEDYESWSGISGPPRFRTDAGDWASGDFAEGEFVKDDDTAIGALADDDRAEPAAEPPPRRARGGRRRAARARRRPPPAESVTRAYEAPVDVGGEPRPSPTVRIATGLGIGALALICWAIGRGGLLVLAMAIVSVAAFELCEAYRRAGYHLATAVALLGSVALVPIAYDKGEQAFPMVAVLVIGFTFLWYLFEVVRARPTVNIALTLLVFCYVGIFGGFAGLLLAPDPGGSGYLMGVVLCAVAYDVVGWFVGSQIGRTPMLERVSPNKTMEGLLAGCIAAIVTGAIVGGSLHPWASEGVGAGIGLGILVAILAPLGDLWESMMKRDLGVKDFGGLLPGHGGAMDRFDAILLCLPAAYYFALAIF